MKLIKSILSWFTSSYNWESDEHIPQLTDEQIENIYRGM